MSYMHDQLKLMTTNPVEMGESCEVWYVMVLSDYSMSFCFSGQMDLVSREICTIAVWGLLQPD